MTNKVQHYRSEVTAIVPATLLPGELAVNTTDKKIWSAGADGVPIEMTTVGPTGAEGPIGPEGPASVVPGPEGAVGPTGPIGPDGADSVVPGPEGPIGVPGADGADGADSTVPGPQGPIGPDGIQGIQGVPGTTGAQGPAGTQILGVFGEITTPVDLPVDGLLPIDFDGPGRPAVAYQFLDGESMTYQPVAGDTDPEWGDVYSWQTTFVAWVLLGKLAGPEGPVGPEGAQGVIGPDGAVGPAGPTAISVDAGNTAVLGTDSLIFVPTVESGASMIVQELKPDEAAYEDGQEWMRTSDMTKFTLYVDVDSRQWVETSSAADSIIPGPVGLTGPIGPTGEVGPEGPPGGILDAYPIGAIYMTIDPADPSTIFGGTWAAFGVGQVIVGVDAAQPEFATPELAGGEKETVLTVPQLPLHNHTGTADTDGDHTHTFSLRESGPTGTYPLRSAGASVDVDAVTNAGGAHTHSLTIDNAGNDEAHNNLQPFITAFFWKRTA